MLVNANSDIDDSNVVGSERLCHHRALSNAPDFDKQMLRREQSDHHLQALSS